MHIRGLYAGALSHEGSAPIKQVVFLSGNIEYFGARHLPYALPAIFVLILTTLPPLFLILHPNGLQLVTPCLGEKNIDKIDQRCNKPSCSSYAVIVIEEVSFVGSVRKTTLSQPIILTI